MLIYTDSLISDHLRTHLPNAPSVDLNMETDNDAEYGIDQNTHEIGNAAVDNLIAQINSRDFGVPTYPRVTQIRGIWRNKKPRKLLTYRALKIEL